MIKNKPCALPDGTVLTTEGKDRILTGKLQRTVAWFLSENWQPSLKELVSYMHRVHGTPAQNVYRTVKALEEKGILRTAKGAKEGTEIFHTVTTDSEGQFVIEGQINVNFSFELHAPGGAVVCNVDFVEAIHRAFSETNTQLVFKTLKKVRADSNRWFVVTFNKPSLYKLAAKAFHQRVNLLKLVDAFCDSPLSGLVEQAARGAWQPFFDTLKKNKVISYYTQPEGRVMVWDRRQWDAYSARLLKQRQEITETWADMNLN